MERQYEDLHDWPLIWDLAVYEDLKDECGRLGYISNSSVNASEGYTKIFFSKIFSRVRGVQQ